MRKLATVRRISEIRSIPDSDNIDLAIVDGWQSVIRKGEYDAGELAIYCEIDSWIPTTVAPFLSKGKEPREHLGVKGERLRTMKLRGQLSQGLLLPISGITNLISPIGEIEGMDVTELLGIKKYEKPIPAQLAGVAKGDRPSCIPKTDQERCQNLVEQIKELSVSSAKFEVTEKLEGTSMTCYMIDGVFGVCSRNLDLLRDQNNSLWKAAIDNSIEEKILYHNWNNIAIQGELIGEGIQGNIYKLKGIHFYVFDIYNIELGEYLDPSALSRLCGYMNLQKVPIIHDSVQLNLVDDLIKMADGKSAIGENPMREGLVFKHCGSSRMSFKVISNAYLCGEK